MGNYFCSNTPYEQLERQMQQPPNYRPRGCGIQIMNQMEWNNRGSYSEIVDIIISRMQMEHLKKRLDEIFSVEMKELIFLNGSHRRNFCTLLLGKRKKKILQEANYAAAVFILSADEKLWERVKENVLERGICFDRIWLGGVTLEQYILYHAAKDVYNRTKHIRLSELTDRELIPDHILRIIVNAFVINECGIEVIKQVVWDDGGSEVLDIEQDTFYHGKS